MKAKKMMATMRRDFWALVGGGMGIGFALGALLTVCNFAKASEKADPERALFMLNCVYDWNLSNETCESILHGEPVPPFDKEVGDE